MPAIYHEGSWLGNATDPEVLVKDTVGWTGKNLADNSKTISMGGASTVFSLNNNGGFSLSGSIRYLASLTPLSNLVVGEQYIASIKVVSSTNSDARLTLRDSTNQIQATKMFGTTPGVYELPFTYQNGWYLSVICNFTATQSSMEIEEIMVRKADITDPTYEPYHESVEEEIEQIYADNGVLGAKNLLENKATTQTLNTIVWTVDATTKKVTAGNQTASANSLLVLNDITLPAGSYKISGCPNYGSNDIFFQVIKSGEIDLKQKNGKPLYFTLSAEKTLTCRLVIASGLSGGNKVWEPMITLASDPDDTYQPYAMTNRELTEENNARFNMEMQSGDVLSVNRTCFFFAAAGCTNLPVSDRGCLVQMIYNTANFKTCLVSPYNIPDIYINVKAGQNWSGWRKFTSTVVS